MDSQFQNQPQYNMDNYNQKDYRSDMHNYYHQNSLGFPNNQNNVYRNTSSIDYPIPDNNQATLPIQQPNVIPPKKKSKLSPEEVLQIKDILFRLEGSKESIKNAKKWLIDHKHACKQIGKALNEAMIAIDFPNFPKKLHILYLINDVLHESMRERKKVEELDGMTLALLFFLADMLRHAHYRHDQTSQDKVSNLLSL